MTKISRKLRVLVLLPTCALLFFIGAVTVQAATYYVAKTGSDANSCAAAQNINTPKLTVREGVRCLTAAGDTLYVRTGTYVERLYYPDFPASGTQAARITVSRYQNEVVTMAPNSGCYAALMGDKDWITIDGLIFDGIGITACQLPQNGPPYSGGGAFAIDYPGGTGLTIRNVEIKNGPGANTMSGDQMLIENTIVHDNGWRANLTGYPGANGLYMEGIRNSTLRNVTTYGNVCFGLRVYNSHSDLQASNNILENIVSHTNGNGKGLNGTATVCGTLNGGGFLIGDQNNTLRNSIASQQWRWVFWSGRAPLDQRLAINSITIQSTAAFLGSIFPQGPQIPPLRIISWWDSRLMWSITG
jgi:hypothetical protein